MKYLTWLKEHGIWICIFSWLLFSLETFLLTLKSSGWLMTYTAISLAAAFFAGTFGEYRRWKKYLTEIQSMTEGLSRKYLVPEMMHTGKRQEEKLLYEIFRSVGKSMNEHVAGYKNDNREYKEYIEMWVHGVKVPIAAARMILENHSETDMALTEEIDRVEGCVEQALFYARSSDVEKDYLIKKVNLQKVTEQTLLQKKRELIGRHASISLHDLDREVYSDGKWMEFILGQILNNSIKYAAKDGLLLEIYSREAKDRILLYIKDNGIGVKEEEVARVFDKGFTGTNGRKYRKSTGIGLYLCKKLCSRLGHNILFSSKEGEGSMVTLIFPKAAHTDQVR